MEIQSIYQETIKYAAAKHAEKNQTIPGTNLQIPPAHWDNAKKTEYHKEAVNLLQELKGGNAYLENRLQVQIDTYQKYIL